MTDFERDYLNKSKEKDFDLNLEDIETIRKELDDADASALIAVFALRSALRQTKNEEVEPQALWRFIRYLTEVEMPLQFVDYTYFLFPDNEKYFAKILTPTAFNLIQRQAKLMLDNNNYEDEKHKEHLTKIANGQMPYGYSLEMPSIKEESEDK